MPKKYVPPVKTADPVVNSLPSRKIVHQSPVLATHPKEDGPFACRYDGFPAKLEAFAADKGITPLKWRVQKGEYILFSVALQKYHVPM